MPSVEPVSVRMISSATDSKFRPLQLSISQHEKLKTKFGLLKDYLMYSGATDYRKNHLKLISAYAQLPQAVRSRHQLAFVGGLPDDNRSCFLSHAEKCGLGENELIITGRVTDNEMIALYKPGSVVRIGLIWTGRIVV